MCCIAATVLQLYHKNIRPIMNYLIKINSFCA
jgi:hypothetical protein